MPSLAGVGTLNVLASLNPYYFGLVLLAGSGFAALAHELLWTRRLIDLLGASAASSTRVFGCFFLGLALGAAVVPILARRIRRPWRAAALAELGVALLALPALFLPQWTGWIWPTLGCDRLLAWEGSAVKLFVSALLVLPPSCCMGMVLPLVVCAVLQERFELRRHGIWLYATNTLGGVLGLVCVTGAMLHRMGADGSMQLAIAINLAVAAGCLMMDLSAPPGERAAQPPDTTRGVQRRVFWSALILAFISGAGILAVEVLALQLVALAAPLSFYAPMSVLTVVILLLAIAAALVPALSRWAKDPAALLWFALLGTALCTALTPLLFFPLAEAIAIGPRATLAAFLAALVLLVLASLGPALLLAGLVFPAALVWVGGAGGDRTGTFWGWLLAANGVGGVCGAEVSYRLVVPLTGVHQGMGLVAALYGGVCVAWVLVDRPRRRAGQLLASLGIFATAAGLTLGPLAQLPHLTWRGVIILDEQVGREGSVAVVHSINEGRRIVMSNQYVLGGSSVRHDQARLAHLPLVMHPRPGKIAFIGLATGITPGAALEHQCVEQLTAVELSPLVARAADLYFRRFNHGVTRDPRARIVVEDARTYLAAAPGSFDVVVGDLMLPWAQGEARLYSLEHFQSVRAALRPGGLYCQWLAMYQLTPEHFEIIQATFCEVFPRAYVFRNTFDSRQPALALVGFRDGGLDWSTIQSRCDELRRSSQVRDPLIRHADGVAMLLLGSTERAGHADRNTLSNMRVELAAARDRVTGQPLAKYLWGERWLRFTEERFLRRLQAGERYSSEQVELAWLGQSLARWETVRRGAPAETSAAGYAAQMRLVQQHVQEAFPDSVRDDFGADWTRWPGDAALVQGANPGP